MITHSFESDGKSVHLSFPDKDDYIARQVINSDGFYERDLLKEIGELLGPGDVVLDIGANIGNHTVYFALICGCTVYSYEPNPQALLYLRVNVQQNGIAGLVHVKPHAVGEAEGRARVRAERDHNIGALSLETCAEGGVFDVVSIDGEGFSDRVSLLKIDVEGMESQVLRGAMKLIERDHPYVICEAQSESEFSVIEALLAERQYFPVGVFGVTPTYLFSHVSRYEGVDSRLIANMRKVVVASAQLKALHVEHRETRKTVIKHTELLSSLGEGFNAVRAELQAHESRFVEEGEGTEARFIAHKALIAETAKGLAERLEQLSSHSSAQLEEALLAEQKLRVGETGELARKLASATHELEGVCARLDAHEGQFAAAGEASEVRFKAHEALIDGAARGLSDRLEQLANHSTAQLESALLAERESRTGQLAEMARRMAATVHELESVRTRFDGYEGQFVAAWEGAEARFKAHEALIGESAKGLAERLERMSRHASAQLESALRAERDARVGEAAEVVSQLASVMEQLERTGARLDTQEAQIAEASDRAEASFKTHETMIAKTEKGLADRLQQLSDRASAQIESALLAERKARERLAVDLGSGFDREIAHMKRRLDGVISQIGGVESKCSGGLASLEHKFAEQQRELSARIDQLNQRHDALLNGRIFGTLSRVKSAFRKKRSTDQLLLTAPKPSEESMAPTQSDLGPVVVQRRQRMERERRQLQAPGLSVGAEPLVSVVMTTFNSSAHVVDAIDSVLAQDYGRLELIIVDDASTDSTLSVLWTKARQDDRVRIIESRLNRGTYWAKNLGILEAKGSLITFMDSDDVLEASRIRKQVAIVAKPNFVASTCNYVRRDESGNIVLNRGLEQRIALISLMVKKEVFAEIGYFDTVRTSADDEFMERVKLVYGRQAIGNVAEPLYIALHRENSLSTESGNGNNMAANEAVNFLSAARHHFVKSYKQWYEEVHAAGFRPYVPFPSTCRPFPVHGKLRVSGDRFVDQPVIAFMASFPARREKLELAVQSLLPQVDKLCIYLNNYDSVPDFLVDERIVVEVGGRDLRDNGKIFHMSGAEDGYFITVDDDIYYPGDYCERLVQAVERHDRGAVVGVHGVILEQPFTRYFSPGRTVYSFKHALKRDTRVNLLGTGTVAFHSNLLRPSLRDFPSTGMADVWMAILCNRQGVPMVSIGRPASWLAPITLPGESDQTLYDEFRENDSAQTEALAAQGGWEI